MKKILTVTGFALTLGANAQNHNTEDPQHLTCAFNVMYYRYCQEHGIDPENDPAMLQYENEISNYINNAGAREERSGVYIIPVVFHVVHLGGAENISDEQIYDAVRILNRDFRKLNADTSMVDPLFKPLIADVEFEFRLAKKDALGNCVSGITRTYSATTNVGDYGMADVVALNLNGGTSSSNLLYPHDSYLNIFVCKDPQGAAGYTHYPAFGASNPDYDAIWMRHDYTGSIGSSSEGHSRALTHEVGHWFNLRHVWGNTNSAATTCGDDLVTDTPETRGFTSCNMSSNDICNPGTRENVQNYMDYSYCCKMFTTGQKTRMHAAANSAVAGRNNLWSAGNLTATGVVGPTTICLTDFTANTTTICAGDSVRYSDISYHGVTGRDWTFAAGTPATSTDAFPWVIYHTPGLHNVTLDITDGSTSGSLTKTAFINVLDAVGAAVPFSEGFETHTSIPSASWSVINNDGQEAWEVVTGVAASGNKCVMIDNFSFAETGARDVFASQTFDLSAYPAAQIYFKYAYRQRFGGENEELKLFVSNNCGLTWSLKKIVIGNALSPLAQATAFTPGPTDWTEYSVVIPSVYMVQGFRFKIEFESAGGNNIYIDDINLVTNVGLGEIENDNLGFNVYPNPVTSMASIEYSLVNSGHVSIQVTDILGQTVAVLENTGKAAGKYNTTFDASTLPAKGVYFITIKAGNVLETRKIVVE